MAEAWLAVVVSQEGWMACGSPFKRSSRSLPIIGDQPQQTYSVRSTHGAALNLSRPRQAPKRGRGRVRVWQVADGKWQALVQLGRAGAGARSAYFRFVGAPRPSPTKAADDWEDDEFIITRGRV
ncbi:hypothetical protein CTRI78_v001683 [Colletotrichum trifolii]|uniref:Uncharacterized protein n=1 Tax=Colletotrichum trifolii TaxID=5466 RepID=A0A4R8RNV1_COLTR|nr:hypothetical protein CTRI78_v001683 [Colletotrichum trifolii]